MPASQPVILSPANHRALVRLSRLKSTPDRPPERLFFYGFVDSCADSINDSGYPDSIVYSISDAGREYLLSYRRYRADILLNRFLAIAALIISLISLLLECRGCAYSPNTRSTTSAPHSAITTPQMPSTTGVTPS